MHGNRVQSEGGGRRGAAAVLYYKKVKCKREGGRDIFFARAVNERRRRDGRKEGRKEGVLWRWLRCFVHMCAATVTSLSLSPPTSNFFLRSRQPFLIASSRNGDKLPSESRTGRPSLKRAFSSDPRFIPQTPHPSPAFTPSPSFSLLF